jgi:polysaccharide biosynthesis transport protein
MTTQPQKPTTTYVPGHALHVSDYLRLLYRRRWTAALAFLVVFVSGAFKTLRTTPIYEASTTIQIQEDVPSRANTLNTVLGQADYYVDDDFYLTQYRILSSRQLALRTVEALGIGPSGEMPAAPAQPPEPSLVSKTVAWIRNVIGAPKRILPPPADETTAQSQAIDGFLGGLSIDPVRNTRLVEIKYDSDDPVFAARAANAVADQYKKQSVDARLYESKDTSDFLQKQIEEQQQKLNESEKRLQEYKEQHDVVSVDDRQNIEIQKLGDLTAAVTRAKTERIDKEAQYNGLTALLDNHQPVDAFPAMMANDFVQRLKGNLTDLQQKKTQLSARYRAGDSQMQEIDQQIADTQKKLQDEEQKVVDAVRTDYQAAVAKEGTLTAALEQQKQQALSLDKKGIEYAALDREVASNRQLYNNLVERAKESGVSGQYKGSNVSVVDTAEVPRTPILPRTSRDLMMAAVGGCLLAFGLVLGFEYMDSRIKTPDDIKAHLGLTFLGLVPVISSKDKDEGDEQPLVSGKVPPSFAEAMRAIRTAVIFSSAEEGARTVAVTSTAPSEGKTLISTNLAAALAQAGQRTLIVDGDMRRPRVHEVFACLQEPGLSNVLVGTARLRDVVLPTTTPNLFLLPAGHIPPNPAELLGSNRYLELMAELSTQYEWIIIDAPPVMAVTDAAVVANRATGVVFVIGSEMTPRRNALAAVEQLLAARAKFIGAVLNRVNVERHSYYYAPYYRRDYTRVYERSR